VPKSPSQYKPLSKGQITARWIVATLTTLAAFWIWLLFPVALLLWVAFTVLLFAAAGG